MLTIVPACSSGRSFTRQCHTHLFFSHLLHDTRIKMHACVTPPPPKEENYVSNCFSYILIIYNNMIHHQSNTHKKVCVARRAAAALTRHCTSFCTTHTHTQRQRSRDIVHRFVPHTTMDKKHQFIFFEKRQKNPTT